MKGSKERLFSRTKTQSANVRANPLCQGTKRHLNNSYTAKNDEKLDEKRNNLSFLVELGCFPVQCLEESIFLY